MAGRARELILVDGPLAWIPVPGVVRRLAGDRAVPRVGVRPGPAGTADVRVGWGPVGLDLRVDVAEGRLTVGFPGRTNPLLRPLVADVRRWVERADAHLVATGRRLEPLEVTAGRAVLRSHPAPDPA